MFGLSFTQLVSLAVKYGPEAIAFIRGHEPELHQIAVGAAGLAKDLIAKGTPHDEAVKQGSTDLAALALKNSYDDKAKGES